MYKKYGLSILIPIEVDNREICRFDSDTPFPTIQKGDLIDPRVWEGENFDMFMRHFEYGDVLKVNNIYHHISHGENATYGQHVIDIFTTIVKKERS